MNIGVVNAFCLGLIGMLLLAASPVHAQDRYDNEPNEFIKPALRSGYDSLDAERNELDTHISASTIYHDSSNGMGLTSFMRPSLGEGETLPRESEQKISTITHQLPMQGQQMLQNSEAIRDMLDKGLDGVMTLFKITAHQTEPAEAAGAQGAEVIAALLQNNMYQSQNLMHLQYIADPNMYRTSMAMYSRCMSDRTAAYTNDNSGSWIKALAECLGDGVATGSAQVQGPSEFATTTNSIYQPEYHPAMRALDKEADEIRLTDLLFNELEKHAQDTGGGTTMDVAKVQRLKNSWLELFGDKVLSFEESPDALFYPIRVGTLKRILPADPNTGETHTIKELLSKRVDARFDTLRDIIHFYCLIKAGQASGSAPLLAIVPLDGVPQTIIADEHEYWTHDPDAYYEYEKEVLSIPGQPMRIITLQGISDNFRQRFADKAGNVNCDPLRMTHDIDRLNDYAGAGDGKYLEFFAKVRSIARNIAEAQMIMAGIYAQQFVHERSSGFGLEPDIRDMALEMISETFNGEGGANANLWDQLAATREALKESINKLYLHRAKLVGKKASIATTVGGKMDNS